MLASLQYVNLSEVEDLAELNPTAEAVAKCVFDRLRAQGFFGIRRIDVTEAPGCVATYEVPAPA